MIGIPRVLKECQAFASGSIINNDLYGSTFVIIFNTALGWGQTLDIPMFSLQIVVEDSHRQNI